MRFELGRLPQTAGWPADIFFRQPLVERHLRDNLARFDTLSFELGWAVAALASHVSWLRHAETGEMKSVTASYLIGADGAIARCASWPVLRWNSNAMSRGWSSIGNLTAISRFRAMFISFATPSGRALWYRVQPAYTLGVYDKSGDDYADGRPRCRARHDAALSSPFGNQYWARRANSALQVYQFHAIGLAPALQPRVFNGRCGPSNAAF